MVAHDFTYPLGHIVTASFWHNLHRDSLHLTIADTGWGKAVWGKLYGQMIACLLYTSLYNGMDKHDKITNAYVT